MGADDQANDARRRQRNARSPRGADRYRRLGAVLLDPDVADAADGDGILVTMRRSETNQAGEPKGRAVGGRSRRAADADEAWNPAVSGRAAGGRRGVNGSSGYWTSATSLSTRSAPARPQAPRPAGGLGAAEAPGELEQPAAAILGVERIGQTDGDSCGGLKRDSNAHKTVEDTTVYTDESPSYKGLDNHESVTHSIGE